MPGLRLEIPHGQLVGADIQKHQGPVLLHELVFAFLKDPLYLSQLELVVPALDVLLLDGFCHFFNALFEFLELVAHLPVLPLQDHVIGGYLAEGAVVL